MNLADMLTYADIGQLNNIASYYDCECKRNSKLELIQSILSKLGRRDFFEELMGHLTDTDLRFLNSLVFDVRSVYSLEELTATIRQASEETNTGTNEPQKSQKKVESPREAVARYRKSGWLFNGFTHSTKYSFQVPSDLKMRFRDVLGERLQERIKQTSEPEVYRDEQGLAAADIVILLKYVENQEIELNAEGFMYRRYQQQLMSSLHIEEPLLSKGAWRFGYGRSCAEYPNRMALLYDYVFARQWIKEAGNRLFLTERGRELLQEGNEISVIQLFRFWLRLYKGAVPNLSSIVYWISKCTKDWITLESLKESLGWLIRPFYYDTSQTILDHRVIQILMHLGMLRIGESNQSGTVIRMTEFGHHAARECLHIGDSNNASH